MREPVITVVGNVAGPPVQRTTPTGVPVANFRIAATPRRLDRATDSWSDGETIWFGVAAWRTLGQHCGASLKKGDRVVVTGELSTRRYVVEGGEVRSNLEIKADSVGLELSKAPAAYQRPAVLVTGSDPWVSSGMVDPDTGVVRPEAAEHLAAERHHAVGTGGPGVASPRLEQPDLGEPDVGGDDLADLADLADDDLVDLDEDALERV